MSNVLKGTIATEGTMKGNLATVYAKDGEDGTNGKSAYEIALDNGFEGTEAEWLESLKGEDGKDGSSGVYVGSGEMPEDCNVQIDPDGNVFEGAVYIDYSYSDGTEVELRDELNEGVVYFVRLADTTTYPFTKAHVFAVYPNDMRTITHFAFSADGKIYRRFVENDAFGFDFGDWEVIEGSGGSGDFDGEKEFVAKNLFNVDTISEEYKYANWVTGSFSDATSDWCHSDYIPVVAGEQYTYSGGGISYGTGKTYFDSYCYYDANKRFVSGERIRATEITTLTMPDNIAYIIINFSHANDAKDNVSFVKTVPDNYYLPKLVVKKEQIEDFHEEDPTEENKSVLLHLPEKYDLVVGDTFELFYKGIMLCKDPYAYNILVSCNIGKAWSRKFDVTPTATGTYPLTITVSDDNGNVIETASTNLVVEAKMTSPTSEKNVLCIGDSLTSPGIWVDEVYRRLTKTTAKTCRNHTAPTGEGLSNIKFIGKNTTPNGAGFEGFGGWKFSSYLSTETTTSNYWLTCTHAKTDNDQESIYQDANGVQWQLETIETARLKFKKHSGSGTMPTSGTLTWVSGGVDTTDITFTKATLEAGNPFVYNGQIDFASYCADVGATGIDICYILLGWNNASTDKATYKSQVKQFIDLLLAYNPNMKVVLMGIQIPSLDGCANNYGATGIYSEWRTLQEYVFSLDELYAEVATEYTGVSSMNISGQFDTEHSMQTVSQKANVRSETDVTVQSNGLHPSPFGYYQIADAVYRKFNNDNN